MFLWTFTRYILSVVLFAIAMALNVVAIAGAATDELLAIFCVIPAAFAFVHGLKLAVKRPPKYAKK